MRDEDTSEFDDDSDELPTELIPVNGVLALYGYGVRMAVDHGVLSVSDGIGSARRQGRFARATHGLSRIVLTGNSGSVTLDALQWCDRLGIAVVVFDSREARGTFSSTPKGPDDARLRRVQGQAADNALGLSIVRDLLQAKLAGHEVVLRGSLAAYEAADQVRDVGEALGSAEDGDEARELEAQAAAAYWAAWAAEPSIRMQFARIDLKRVPEHWLRFDGRRSFLMSVNGNRHAERPINAILNYLYALVETEAILACHRVGLDPGLGLLHLDARNRASLALDLMEPARPAVERYVLDLIAIRAFRRRDFVEAADGHVRILPPLTLELASTTAIWAREIAPWAERLVATLGKAVNGKWIPTAPLTGARRRQAQAALKTRKTETFRSLARREASRQRPTGDATLDLQYTCQECGQPMAGRFRQFCLGCGVLIPGQDRQARDRRGMAIAAKRAELAAWKTVHTGPVPDKAKFRSAILPKLKTVKLSAIVDACGVAKSTASMIRSGQLIPAARHWHALETLARL